MSVLRVLGVEAIVIAAAFGLAYGAISLVLWRLSRSSERRIRERAAGNAPTSRDGDASG